MVKQFSQILFAGIPAGVFRIFRRKCRRDRLLDPMKTIEKRKKCPYYAAFFES
jgi:hypothetical protein